MCCAIFSDEKRYEDNINSSGSNSDRTNNIFEVLDALISHMNTTRNIFTLMISSAFILAPLAIIVTGIFILHPFFLHRILLRLPEVAGVLLLFIMISIALASLWLFIGVKEQAFFSKWNKKYGRFQSLRDGIDRELAD